MPPGPNVIVIRNADAFEAEVMDVLLKTQEEPFHIHFCVHCASKVYW
jgi:hypothetical protein